MPRGVRVDPSSTAQTAPEVIVKDYLLGTKAIHAPINGLQEGDAAMATLCRPNKALLGGVWVSGKVTCGVCIQRITSAHVEALKLNEAYDQGVQGGLSWAAIEGASEDRFSTFSDLDLADERAISFKHLHTFLGSEKTTWRNRIASITYHARQLTLVEAEITRRQRTPEMPTENNYGEQGPFHFTEHPHDQVRAQRYDSIINTLTEMVANANQPVPTTAQLIDAIIGLEHGEAIQEDSARFPHESFTRFGVPVPVKHRLADGTIEQVHMIGSDVSRRVYPQNVVLIARPYGMAQVVPEGDLVS